MNALYTLPGFLGENDDPKRRDALLAEFQMGLDVCKAIGSHPFIIVPPLQRDSNWRPLCGTREETFENCVRILKQLGR